jgi:hypothetical protein
MLIPVMTIRFVKTISGAKVRLQILLAMASIYIPASRNNISDNGIVTKGRSSGIKLYVSSNSNYFKNNSIFGYGSYPYGISLESSPNNNIFTNISIEMYGTYGRGVGFSNHALNSSFSNMKILTNGSNGYSLEIVNGNYTFNFTDSILNSSLTPDFYIMSSFAGTFNFTNVTREDGSPITVNWQSGAVGTLNHHWWADSNVTAANVPIEGALISASDKDSSLRAQETTDASGRSRMALLEYSMTGPSDITYYNNYSLETTKEGYLPDVQSFNLTETKNLQHEVELDGGNFVMIDSCQDLNQTDAIYLLTANVTSSATCFNIIANNVTLDCQGHEINYSSAGVLGYGVNVTGYNHPTIRNCVIKEGVSTTSSKYGVYLGGVNSGTIEQNVINSTLGFWSSAVYASSSSQVLIANNSLQSGMDNAHVIFLVGTTYSNVTNNTIIRTGGSAYGITVLSSSQNNLFEHNRIIGSTGSAGGMQLGSLCSNNIIRDNIIDISGTTGGIFINTGANNFLSNNEINTSNLQSYVVYGTTAAHYDQSIDTSNLAEGLPVLYNYSVNDAVILENVDVSGTYGQIICAWCNNATYDNVTMGGDGINLFNTSNSNILNSKINTSVGRGIWLYQNSNNNNISWNNVTTSGTNGHAIYLQTNSNSNNLFDNDVTTWGSNGIGIYLATADSNNINNNRVVTNTGTSSRGLYISTGSNNYVSDTNITCNAGINAAGCLELYPSSDGYFNNVIMNSEGVGLYIRKSGTGDNNYFENSYFKGGTFGFFTVGSPLNTTFRNCVFNATTRPIDPYMGTPTIYVIDSILVNRSSAGYSVYVRSEVTGGEWNFTNVTREDGSPITVNWQSGANGTLNMHWYLDANVTSSGNALESANVSSYDVNDVLSNTSLTDVQGRTRHVLLEMTMNSSTGEVPTTTYYNNYTLNVSKEGYTDEVRSYNLTIEGNVWADVEMGENVPPVLTIISPVNNSKFNSSVVSFDVSGDEVMDWCGLSLDGAENVSMILNGTATGAGYVDFSVIDGSHDFVVYCNDTAGNMGTSDLGYFFVDTIYPLVDFVSPTLDDGNVSDDNWIYVNVSSSDTLSNVSTFIDWDNSLVSWWRMDDANETHVFDYMSRNNGTIHGDAKQTDDGVLGKAFEFDGSGDYLNMGNSNSFDLNNFTFSAWVNPASLLDVTFILSKLWSSYEFGSTGNKLYFEGTGTEGRVRVNSGSLTAITNSWQHATVTWGWY